MRRVKGLLLLIGIAFILGAGSWRIADVRAAPSGSVSGQVRNGGPGGKAVGGAEVDLHAFDGTNDLVILTTTSDASGAYQFDNIEINPSAEYSVSVTFANVPYFSQPFKFDASGHQAADLTVYGTTPSDVGISIDRLSIVVANVDSKQHLLTLVESYHFNNSGQQTYVGQLVGSSVQSLRFPLFGGAESLTPEGGFALSDATSIPSGFALSTPLLPGASTIVFAYQVPYQGRTLALDRVLAYKTALAEVILPGGFNLSSPQLGQQGSISIGGRNLDTIQGKDLQPGEAMLLQFTGLPLSSSSLLPLESLRTQLFLVLIVIAAATLSIIAYRGHAGKVRAADLKAERQRLLRQIARLDDRFEAGKLDQQAYTHERDAAKARLREIAAIAQPAPEPQSAPPESIAAAAPSKDPVSVAEGGPRRPTRQ